MAPKAVKQKKAAKTRVKSLDDRVCVAALKISAKDGWSNAQIARVAEEADAPIGEVISKYPTSNKIASALMRRIDNVVLTHVERIDISDSPRDRLFEVLMLRFDALQSSRAGYASLVQARMDNPSSLFVQAPSILHSMALMLIASGIEAGGIIGMARVHALALAYGSVVKVWLDDESADLAPTMSALDKALGRLQQMESLIAKAKHKCTKPEDAEPENT